MSAQKKFSRTTVNVILFQAAWFAAVLGAAHGMPWLGVVAVPAAFALHLAFAPDRTAELLLATAAAGIGFAADTVLIAAGAFAPVPYLLPHSFSSPWMVMLWVNLAMTMNASMAWMRGRYALGAVFGAVGGPAAYYGGAKLGAMITVPQANGLLTIGAAWALVFPLLLRINEVIRNRFAVRKEGTL
jgi:hypothetical protein